MPFITIKCQIFTYLMIWQDEKIYSSKLAEMFVRFPLQAERELNTSQVNCKDNGCNAGISHWKLKKTFILAFHLEETSKREKDQDLPWESSFSSCHSEDLPRRRRCHLDCWELREGWFWMVTRFHHGSVSLCLAVWNSAALSFVEKKWAWKATGKGRGGMTEHSTSCTLLHC